MKAEVMIRVSYEGRGGGRRACGVLMAAACHAHGFQFLRHGRGPTDDSDFQRNGCGHLANRRCRTPCFAHVLLVTAPSPVSWRKGQQRQKQALSRVLPTPSLAPGSAAHV